MILTCMLEVQVLIGTLFQVWGATACRAGVDLAQGWIAAVDGEKDPRCLLASFGLLQVRVRTGTETFSNLQTKSHPQHYIIFLVPPQAVVDAYHTPGVSTGPLEASAGEIVEVLSCYFPISFTPPKNDPHK